MRAPTPPPESSPTSQPAPSQANSNSPPYPPCVFRSHEEKQLYRRLKTIYEQHSSTWDQESRDAWPWLVERASLKPTTTKKVTSHLIAKTLRDENITWAHVVVLRVIFKQAVFASRKMMKMIRRKYPSANLNTFTFSEDYKEDVVATMWDAGSSKEMAAGMELDEEERDDSPSESSERGGAMKSGEAEDEKKPVASSSMPPRMKDEEAEDEKKPALSPCMPSPRIKKDEGVRLKQEDNQLPPLDALFDMPKYPADDKKSAAAAATANKRKSAASEVDYDSDQNMKFKLWAKIPIKTEKAEKKEESDKIKTEAETEAPPAKRAKTAEGPSKPRTTKKRAAKKNQDAEAEEEKGADYKKFMEAVGVLAASMKELSKTLEQMIRPEEED